MGDGRANGLERQPGRLREPAVIGDEPHPPAGKPLAQHRAETAVEREQGFALADPPAIGRVDHHEARRPLGPREIGDGGAGERGHRRYPGARGILVNVTGGENLSIGEFNQVGEAVKHCASEDATVVIGTVIDPEMGDAIRVTVVATGLGQPAVRQQPIIRMVPQPVAVAPRQAEAGARNARETEPVSADVYGSAYDQPAWMRKRAVGDQLTDSSDTSFDLLDVPAFLRRQAD